MQARSFNFWTAAQADVFVKLIQAKANLKNELKTEYFDNGDHGINVVVTYKTPQTNPTITKCWELSRY